MSEILQISGKILKKFLQKFLHFFIIFSELSERVARENIFTDINGLILKISELNELEYDKFKDPKTKSEKNSVIGSSDGNEIKMILGIKVE